MATSIVDFAVCLGHIFWCFKWQDCGFVPLILVQWQEISVHMRFPMLALRLPKDISVMDLFQTQVVGMCFLLLHRFVLDIWHLPFNPILESNVAGLDEGTVF